MTRSSSGQALIEWALLLPLYLSLFAAMAVFGQWFAIRHQLICATREAAFLYSSGRLTAAETRALVQKSLQNGYPRVVIPDGDIQIGRRSGVQARLFRLDEIHIQFQVNKTMRAFGFRKMEERCVIKHAPSYWQTQIPGANLGPPVSW